MENNISKKIESVSSNYELDYNKDFLGFQKVETTKTDDTKPWKPALEVKVIKADGSVVESIDANVPFFTFRSVDGAEMTVTATAAGHIDQLHIKGEDAGSKFDYPSLEALFKDIAKKLPPEIAAAPGVSDFSIDMGRHMGKEGIASMTELMAEGILSKKDLDVANLVRLEVQELNRVGNEGEKKAFIEKFRTDNPQCGISFQLVRGAVLVPTVDTLKRDTTKLFVVFGPGVDGKKTVYTMAPGRHMPKHPNPDQHKNKDGLINEVTFKESSDAWFETVMLSGKNDEKTAIQATEVVKKIQEEADSLLTLNPKNRTLTIPIKDPYFQGIEESKQIDGLDFKKKEEFHITAIGFAKAKELKEVFKEKPELEFELNSIIGGLDWSYKLKDEKFQLTQDAEKTEAISKKIKKQLSDPELKEVVLRELQLEGKEVDIKNGVVKQKIHKESIIQMVDMPALEQLYSQAKEIGIDLGEQPPAHITLYVYGDSMGIGVNSKEDLKKFKAKPL